MSQITRLESYQDTEEQWQSLLSASSIDTLFLTSRWQRTWWDQFGNGSEIFLLCFQNGNSVEGIAPLARHRDTFSFVGGQDLFDYNDFLVRRGSESRFYPSLLDYLDGQEWETLQLSSVLEDSPTLTYLPDLARQHGYSVEVEKEDVSPRLSLPDSWDAYLRGLSKKDRHELRRKLRRLESSGEEVRWYKLSDPEEIEGNLGDFFSLMRNSKEAKHRFLTQPREQFFRNIALEMASIGVFKLFFMELNGQRVSAAMCFDYGTARHLYNSGFNPEYGYYSVGLALKAFCVQDAIEEGKAYFDFLRGSESYKYDLGGKDRIIYQMVVRRN